MTKYITDLKPGELIQIVTSLQEPVYRARQVSAWVYQKYARTFAEMTDLPASFREKLAAKISLHCLEPVNEIKALDGTVKVLLKTPEGSTIESALMLYAPGAGRPRTTVCLSSQVGCVIGCLFCATGQQGFIRNLTAGEIVDQVLYWQRYVKDNPNDRGEGADHITNVVFMGMGEPFMNYAAVWQAIESINSPEEVGIGARNITISTAGLVPEILKLSQEKLQVGLAISLHAPDNALRDKLVPVNRKYPLERLMQACREYLLKSGRRLSFEYIMLKGINDSVAQAGMLARLLAGMNCHVNLIPANTTDKGKYQPSPMLVVRAFQAELERGGINCTVRQSRGQDIKAGCGQLKSRFTQ
ncbi:MAG: 23S rRNA (adenine(2503)-C(2))-methyltransferase RlmN [Dehalococcoidales bacterium]|nr:23S rRNA (adenine(2503)-C(2))-methyltransferase RlmN [Dehalococcoidales bacterium]